MGKLFFILIVLILLENAGVFFWMFRKTKKNNLYYTENNTYKETISLLYALVNHMKDIVLMLDEKWNIVVYSEYAVEVYGYTRNEFSGMNIEQVLVHGKTDKMLKRFQNLTDQITCRFLNPSIKQKMDSPSRLRYKPKG